jgi:hypothetical protein
MLALAVELGQRADLILLMIGLALLYVSSRTAVDALVRPDDASPGRRALGHHLPIAAVAVAGTLLREPALAIGVLFGASVASLSLGCGSVALTAERRIDTPPEWRRVWPFVVAVLAMLAGLSGTLTLAHAGMFFAEGLVLWLLWHDQSKAAQARPGRTRPVALLLALGLATVGAWAAARGAIDLSRGARAVTIGTVAATMIGPILVLPMLGSGATLASRGAGGVAVTSQVGVVLLNLCLWLPLVIGGTYWQPAQPAPVAVATTQPTTRPTTQESTATTTPSTQPAPSADEDLPAVDKPQLVFPVIVWRVDTIVLLVLGMILLPPAIGRWPLSKRDGIIMLVVYVAYLMVVAAAGRR